MIALSVERMRRRTCRFLSRRPVNPIAGCCPVLAGAIGQQRIFTLKGISFHSMYIAVGMSGGVDSSVAALLLKQQGHDIIGLTMKIWREGMPAPRIRGNTCFGPEEQGEIEQTRALCKRLAIAHRVIDCSSEYATIVLDYFRREYRSGRTPNPCIRCNHEVKFGVLPDLAKKSGMAFDAFATGHYARIEKEPATGRFLLKKGVDPKKDQSYFLYRLSQDQLSRTLFPLGGLRKEEVRAIAHKAGLDVYDKEESQDFYSDRYSDIVGEKDRPGDIVDSQGKALGRHRGIWNYTIGQRKGLRIAYAEPLYVLRIDAERNRIVVGTEQETRQTAFTVNDCAWSAVARLDSATSAAVKIRSATQPAEAALEPLDGTAVHVSFRVPQSGITPGQSAVFYRGDTVLGGGTINRVL
ncbi:MAG: tRNA 2-thiouridine(34) synthase MnmA [Chitinispirillaceae bacterium]|nr:tRNA 2-thiouridine(34) synthase MnmA [Chitinispirillaceae bacterium]